MNAKSLCSPFHKVLHGEFNVEHVEYKINYWFPKYKGGALPSKERCQAIQHKIHGILLLDVETG